MERLIHHSICRIISVRWFLYWCTSHLVQQFPHVLLQKIHRLSSFAISMANTVIFISLKSLDLPVRVSAKATAVDISITGMFTLPVCHAFMVSTPLFKCRFEHIILWKRFNFDHCRCVLFCKWSALSGTVIMSSPILSTVYGIPSNDRGTVNGA